VTPLARVVACATLAIAGRTRLDATGQVGRTSRVFRFLLNVGLPPSTKGVIADDSHRPNSPRRLSGRPFALTADDAAGAASPSRYRAGVIVRSRPRPAMSDRREAVRAASRTGEIAARPSYADLRHRADRSSERRSRRAAILRTRSGCSLRGGLPQRATAVPNDPLVLDAAVEFSADHMEKAGTSTAGRVHDHLSPSSIRGWPYRTRPHREPAGLPDDQATGYPALGN